MIRRITLLALVIVSFAILSACNASVPVAATPTAAATNTVPPTNPPPTPSPVPPTATLAPTATPTPEPTATLPPQPVGPDNFPAGVNPLTGLKVSDPTLLDRRPLSVKVQLFPRGGRPPWGVSLADIVWDFYQNNGMTRLHAVFYGNDADQIGPIRSGRLFDAAIVRMYKTVFAFGGADQRIYERLTSIEIADRLVLEGSNNCPPMCRVEPNGGNYLVTNTEDLADYAEEKGISMERQDLNGMRFDPETPPNGKPVTEISSHFSISAYTRWDYDADSRRYLRFQDTVESNQGQGEVLEPLVDRLTGEQLAADNVVVVVFPHSYFYRSNSGNSEIIEITASGSGPAYAFRDGQVFEVQWNRPTLESVLYLTFPDGSLYPYKPGNTWYQIVGQTSEIEKGDQGSWRFNFSIP